MIVSEKLQATISHNKLISLGPDTAVSRYKERDILPTRCTRLHHVFSASCVIDTLCTRGRRISLILEVSPCTKDNTHTKRKINHNGLITNGIMMPRHILCLSPARTWISNVLCHGLLNFSVSEGERWEVRGERWLFVLLILVELLSSLPSSISVLIVTGAIYIIVRHTGR